MHDDLTYHTCLSSTELDAQYNLRAARPDFEETLVPDWTQRSETARNELQPALDIRYGDGPKQRLDVFGNNGADAPVLIYIHGGYWHRGDKSMYSFLAKPYAAAGVNLVVAGYDLCPAVSLTHICEEIRQALAFTWKNATDLGLNRNRLTLMGHSAGGHLTQMMMATHWPSVAKGLPADLIKAGISISPISYLEPVRLTEALNIHIRLSEAEADSQSPMIQHPPLTDAPQLVIVGGAETDEFHRQAHMYVNKYVTDARDINLYVVPDVDHFDELNVLADSHSEFFGKTLAILDGTMNQ
ncbi:MAG: alpha/beta hydrolase [Granulosicoccus sp.]